MKFVDFNKGAIVSDSILEDNYYIYTLGAPVEVTTIKSSHKNNLIASKLADEMKEDKLMIKYRPTNKIYFSKNFIENDTEEFYASCYLDVEKGRLYVGTLDEFGNSSGVLAFSGYLSLNNLVEEDRPILCTERMKTTIMNRIRVMSVGVRGDKLYGLFYIPSVKGMKLSIRGRVNVGISPITYKLSSCKNSSTFTIKDWFDGLTKIKEI